MTDPSVEDMTSVYEDYVIRQREIRTRMDEASAKGWFWQMPENDRLYLEAARAYFIAYFPALLRALGKDV